MPSQRERTSSHRSAHRIGRGLPGILPVSLATTLRRTRSSWPLLVVLTSITTIGCAIVVSLGLLASSTEQAGVRDALDTVPEARTSLQVRASVPFEGLAASHEAIDGVVAEILGPRISAASTTYALSGFIEVPSRGPLLTLGYFGELDTVDQHATLVAGEWPAELAEERNPADPVPVAMPQAAAGSLGLGVGDTLVLDPPGDPLTVQVSGIYTVDDQADDYWTVDPLRGQGDVPDFPKPDSREYIPTHAFGPLVLPPRGMDAASLDADFLDLTYTPDFSGLRVDDLGPLETRLDDLDTALFRDAGATASAIYQTTQLPETVRLVSTGLVVTRSTVAIASLLVLLASLAAIWQASRIYAEARAGERALLRSRGASAAQLVGLAAIETALIAVATAVLGPLLAVAVIDLLATRPALSSAASTGILDLPAAAWITAAALGAAFGLVLLAPLIRPPLSFADAERAAARPRLVSGVARSGLDLAVVALAGIAYWQLLSHQSSAVTEALPSVDPVLAAAPSVVLLGAALLCVRLVPLFARAFDGAVPQTRGPVLALVLWEVGRRARRATAAVLLLSLCLGVATFASAFLATWTQSQRDQAAVAVGAPARVDLDAAQSSPVAADFSPTLRRLGSVSIDDGGTSTSVQLLGLDPAARALLTTGRQGEVGGARIADRLAAENGEPAYGPLPAGSRGLTMTVALGDPAAPLPDASADVSAVLVDSRGYLRTVPMGAVTADGTSRRLAADLGGDPSSQTSLAGIRFSLTVGEEASPDESQGGAGVIVSEISALDTAPSTGETPTASTPITFDDSTWSTVLSPYASVSVARDDTPPAGSSFALFLKLPAAGSYGADTVSFVAWAPVSTVQAVLPTSLSRSLRTVDDSTLQLILDNVPVTLQLHGTVDAVPGAASAAEVRAGESGASAPDASVPTAVVDLTEVSRALIQAGDTGVLADEWWVDLPPGAGVDYVDSLAAAATEDSPVAAVSIDTLAEALLQAPLRAGTPAALWLTILAAGLLAAVGFAIHTASSLRARRLELAQLRAIGLTGRQLLGAVALESAVLVVLGVVIGVGVGVLLAAGLGPLVSVSAGGVAPVPSVIIVTPWPEIALLTGAVVVVVAAAIAIATALQRAVSPAALLRGGGS
ncbi:FtsX-like permease family protein [Amnibacterium flavum]|uniref:ABC3 transporter permease C-terminal domain-containing protein n=1 Tax=Amnibacterium flavum TaxID=2173173 RepID=A0A2V1HPZ8_9MICO|nr:FtsX-like permease family protein [Amnibacterium flavum]PVZ93682.1 hypothetical protein DDQ50_07700 [Amnibacterium flavum]